jgi:hypothetical protein
MAQSLGLTERRLADIIKNLAASGLLEVSRRGRRNYYTLNLEAPIDASVLALARLKHFMRLSRFVNIEAGLEQSELQMDILRPAGAGS